jgi:hypothetical protein
VNADVADLVRGYLTRNGWEQASVGPAGAMWRHGTTGIAVPEEIRYQSFEWRGVVDRIARHEGRDPAAVAADVTRPAGEAPALTCECCGSAPATRLLVADFLKFRRMTRLACGTCGRRNIRYGGAPPTFIRLYTITEVPHE